MKIVTISDTHNYHNRLIIPECDVLIHAGDLSSLGHSHEVINFISWFDVQPAKYKLFTMGNHEVGASNKLDEIKEILEKRFPDIKLLLDEGIKINGTHIYMSPYTPRYGNWAFMKDRGDEIAEVWNKIPDDVDILVTHGPPHGILDISIYDNAHCGCEELLKRVEKLKPKAHIFGHIHHYGGQWREYNGIYYMNAAICNEQYRPVNKMLTFEYDNGKIKILDN